MAPTQVLTSNIIMQEVQITGVTEKAQVDCGATTSCCSRHWYKRYHAEVGSLIPDLTHVIGVGNTPIYIDGRTDMLPLRWGKAISAGNPHIESKCDSWDGCSPTIWGKNSFFGSNLAPKTKFQPHLLKTKSRILFFFVPCDVVNFRPSWRLYTSNL